MSVVTLTVVAARTPRIAADATIAKASTIPTIRTLFPARRSNLPPISVILLLRILTILNFGYGFPIHPRPEQAPHRIALRTDRAAIISHPVRCRSDKSFVGEDGGRFTESHPRLKYDDAILPHRGQRNPLADDTLLTPAPSHEIVPG